MMDVALPTAAGMDCYEDMFKEITRKLYGEEGLPDNMAEGTEVHCHPDYDGEGNGEGHSSALTAFGLAALMQNGFPPHPGILRMDHMQESKYRTSSHPNPSAAEDKWISSEEVLQWTSSQVASYNPSQKLFRCADCECVGFLSRVAEHWLGTHANLRVFQCPQCPYASAWARCVRMHLTRQHDVSDPPGDAAALYKENPVLEEVTKFLQRLKAKVETRASQEKAPVQTPKPALPPSNRTATSTTANSENVKRYCCGYCPYATDRRDLFTRHENIHREEKPFQCYVCHKQFNRADHVKKHFLRMHRDYPYDLNRIRRQPPKNASGMSYYHKYNTTTPSSSMNGNQRPPDGVNNVHEGILTPGIHQGPHHLNIPGGFSSNLGPRMSTSNVDLQKQNKPVTNGCNAKSHGGKLKRKGDKRYSCCYCSWSGVDNWCLKRHLNTHLKPFVCGLCDYKAARSERLATHVLKVHNKKTCSRCSFLADDQVQLGIHLQEHHPLDHRNNRASNTTVRTGGFPSHPSPMVASSFGMTQHPISSATISPYNHYQPKRDHYEAQHRPTKNKPQYGGAARLFHYLEASDTSEPDDDPAELNNMFPEEEEPPPFVCAECGCEFIDDTSLDTHVASHHRSHSARTCALGGYECSVCSECLPTQGAIMHHMSAHSRSQTSTDSGPLWERRQPCLDIDTNSLSNRSFSPSQTSRDGFKRSRKQSQPRKFISEFSDSEIRVLRHSGHLKRRRISNKMTSSLKIINLILKHTKVMLNRKRLKCNWCRLTRDNLPYHTRASLALHQSWRHVRHKYQCEHCDKRFCHQYQVVLHSSRIHVNHYPCSSKSTPTPNIPPQVTTVPQSMKDPISNECSTVPVKLSPQFSNVNCLNIPVPDQSHHHANNVPRMFSLFETYHKHPNSLQQNFPPLHSSSSLHQQNLLVPTLLP